MSTHDSIEQPQNRNFQCPYNITGCCRAACGVSLPGAGNVINAFVRPSRRRVRATGSGTRFFRRRAAPRAGRAVDGTPRHERGAAAQVWSGGSVASESLGHCGSGPQDPDSRLTCETGRVVTARTGLRARSCVRGRAQGRASRPRRAARVPLPENVVYSVATFLTRPSNDKLGVSKKGLSPLDLPPGLIRTVLSSREPPRAQISIK